jgi:hypothetical protein
MASKQSRSKRIDVCATINELSTTERLFGTHVAHRAQYVARLREARGFSTTGEPEIGDPQFALIVDDQIRRLHVPVDDSVLVCSV